MRKFLIPLVACMVCIVANLNAQVPLPTKLSHPFKFGTTNLPEMACDNKAGTFKLGTFKGQSNAAKLDTIYLCYNDSIFIDHNGDSVLVSDPIKSTKAGIVWGMYTCKPTVTGPELNDIVQSATGPGDGCIISKADAAGTQFLPLVVKGGIGGDAWFFNGTNGDKFRADYGNNRSVLLYFAPMTIDRFDDLTWESGQVGFPPGACVNVNTSAAFAVYYLSPIKHETFQASVDGNDCIGSFNISGGFPDTDNSLTYDISIALKSNPSVKGLIRKPQSQLRNKAAVEFSVPQAGVYVVTVEDGKSCDYTFEVNMGSCTPADNVVIDFPKDTVAPGKPICVPVAAQKFTGLSGASFSIKWDPAILSYTSVQNYHAEIPSSIVNLNDTKASNGLLGVFMFQGDPSNTIDVPNNGTLFEVCFTAVGPLQSCTGLTLINNPSQIDASGPAGQLAVSVDTGSVCILNIPLSVQFALQDSTCQGTAKLKVVADGGSAPYDITYQPVGGGATGSGTIAISGGTYLSPNLPAGQYRVCLRDENGIGSQLCDTVDINLSILGAALDLTQLPRCNGDKNGTVTAQVFRGTTPDPVTSKYAFAWTPATLPQNVKSQSNIGAGNYAVTIRDTKTGCTAVASGTLGDPSLVNDDSISVKAASCSGVADGAVFYSLEGGTPLSATLYNYTWTYSAKSGDARQPVTSGTGNPVSLTNKAAGIYYLEAKDGNGCPFKDSVEITATRTLTLGSVITNAKCSYSADGAAAITITANPPFTAPNYTFTWTPTGPGVTNAATTSNNTGLKAGKYFLKAVETSGCSVSDTIKVGAPAAFVLDTVTLANPTCLSPNNGSLQVIAQGGTGFPNYKYQWSNNRTTAQISGLSSGTYSVTATDNNNCRDSLSFSIKLPNPPVINPPTLKQPRCGDDGCITVSSPANGAKYQWQNLAGSVLGDSAAICNLPGDTFVVVVRDALMCESRDTFTLTPVVPLAVSEALIKDPGCATTKTGSVRVAIAGGQAPYSYSWSITGQSLDSLSNIGAGTYTFKVVDAKDCILTDTFTLKDPPAILPVFSALTPASCSDTCNGGARVIVRYNTTPPTNGAFSLEWDDESADSVRVNLCPGFRKLTITDLKGCVKVDSVKIESPAPVGNDTLYSVPATCFGKGDGTATIAGSGGNGTPYTYQWSTAATTATVNNLTPGNYTVTVRDTKGCKGTFTVEVKQPDSLKIEQDAAATKQPSCAGKEDGKLGVTVVGGNTGTFTFVWSNGTKPVGSTQVVSPLLAGTYAVTATDSKGCTGTVRGLVLSDPASVQGRYDNITPIRCNGEETTLSVDTIFGGRGGPYQYSIDNGVPLSPNTKFDIGGGEHIISYFDGFGCAFVDSFTLTEPNPITVAFNPDEVEIELGESLLLEPIIGGAVVDSFIWNPIELLKDPKSITPTAYTFESQEYKLTVFDKNGCIGNGSIVVNIDANRNIYMPNIFHPGNPAGTNDYFNVQTGRGVEIINYFRVFDRWGTLLYEAENFDPPGTNISEGWDGRYRGKYVNPDVYIYILEAKFLDGRILLFRGDVTVVR